MSIISTSSPKHCAKQGRLVNINRKLYKKFFFVLSAFFTTVLSVILLVWLILRPTKPEFSLREVDIYQLNLSDPNLLSSSILLTLQSRNPNQKVGIYYDELQVYAAYKGQQITVDSYIPPFYQGHQDNDLLTASLIGSGLPVASSFKYEVGRDQIAGKLILNLKMNGKIRWKVGTWVSGKYRVFVNCIALLPFGPDTTGPLSTKQGTLCSTNV